MAVRDFTEGFKSFPTGIRWLRQHPKQMLLLLVPLFLSLIALVLGLSFFFSDGYQWFQQLFSWSEPQETLKRMLYFAAVGLFYLVSLTVWSLFCLLIAVVVSSPIYDLVSVAFEKSTHDGKAIEIGVWASIKLVKEEIKKFLMIALISLVVLLIPGVNFLGIVVAGFLVSWDLYDYTFARRGFSWAERVGFMRKDFFKILGFGLWFMIPFVSFLLVPLGITGATKLALERLDK